MSKPDQVTDNKQVLQTFLELFMSGKWDDFDQVIAADCVLHEPGGVDIVGLEAMKALWREAYAALKNMDATTLVLVSEGDMLAGIWAFGATYDGDYRGQQIPGVPVKFNQAEAYHIVGGKIVEWWVVFDGQWMADQLGFELKPK
jgi:predicted ester cyclase